MVTISKTTIINNKVLFIISYKFDYAELIGNHYFGIIKKTMKKCHRTGSLQFSTFISFFFLFCLPQQGFPTLAERLLSVFKWGSSFFSVNREFLEAYSSCTTSAQVVAEQERIVSQQRKDSELNKQKGN